MQQHPVTWFEVMGKNGERLQRFYAELFGWIRNAVARLQKLKLEYSRQDGQRSTRVVRPLAAFFWGRSWTLTGYCELRTDFRSFRIDRIRKLELLDERFEPEAGKTLADFLRGIGPRASAMLGE